jgi:monoamine oxidase
MTGVLLLAAVVQSIDYSGDKVKVLTADGREFTAKYAILTASLGCLKHGDIAFSPSLPGPKSKAIKDM